MTQREWTRTGAGIVGGLGLLLGVIGTLWAGGLVPLTLGLLIVGTVGTVVWVALDPGEIVRLLTGRGAQYSTVTVIGLVLLVGLIVSLYLAAQGARLTVDLTDSGQFTLSPETLDVIERFDRDVRITGFYSGRLLPQREVDNQFFQLYTVASEGRITVDYIDPDQNPTRAEAFGVQFDGDVFVSYVDEAGEADLDTVLRVEQRSAQERDVTGALLRLQQFEAFRVAFEIGYSTVNPDDESETGLSGIITGLENSGVIVGGIDLSAYAAQDADIPSEINAILFTQMSAPLDTAAVAVLDRYVQGGGSLFIMADADLRRGTPFLTEDSVFNTYLWQTFGLQMIDGVVVDNMVSGQTPFDIVSVTLADASELTANLNDPNDQSTSVQFPIARGVRVNTSPPVSNGIIIDASPGSYIETDQDTLVNESYSEFENGVDPQGPITTAAWAHNQDTGSKLVLVGDDDFVTNQHVGAPFGNSIFFTNAITWVTNYGESVSFAPTARVTNLPVIFVTLQTLDQIALLTLVLIPGAVLLLGLGVWWRRR